MTQGRFISLEGGEGTGKSTQARAVAGALEKIGYKVLLTREPGGTSGAETIRELLLTGAEEKWNIRTEALLFAAARAEHCAKLIRPALSRGDWVICDRFIDSSRAYQSVNGQLSDSEIMDLHRIGSENLMPDRTFILDLPEAVASRRAEAREYHRAVMTNFRRFAADEPERIRLVDASQSVDAITENLVMNLDGLMS